MSDTIKCISVIGLGYVGLPLAVEFAKHFKVVGFDVNRKRIDELNKGIDHTLEVDANSLKNVLGKMPDLGTVTYFTALIYNSGRMCKIFTIHRDLIILNLPVLFASNF